jgi:hypothetical protein
VGDAEVGEQPDVFAVAVVVVVGDVAGVAVLHLAGRVRERVPDRRAPPASRTAPRSGSWPWPCPRRTRREPELSASSLVLSLRSATTATARAEPPGVRGRPRGHRDGPLGEPERLVDPLRREIPTMVEVMRGSGWRTAGPRPRSARRGRGRRPPSRAPAEDVRMGRVVRVVGACRTALGEDAAAEGSSVDTPMPRPTASSIRSPADRSMRVHRLCVISASNAPVFR